MKTEEGPWISLPSKHHPDEIYYFNVTTGESTWEKPESYSEPVDDSTNLQCVAKPSTPERTETCSYIVESLSPSTSPRKCHNASRSMSEVFDKEGSENKDERIVQRKKKKIKDYPYQTDRNTRRKLMKDNVNEVHFSCNERDSKNDPHRVVCKPFMKEGTSYVTTVQRFPSSDYKVRDLQADHRSPQVEHSSGKFISRKMTDNNNYMAFPYPSISKSGNQLISKRSKLSDIEGVYGSASLRLERLKKQLAEERVRRFQQSKSGKRSNKDSSRTMRTDSSYDAMRKPVENLNHGDMSSHYSKSLKTQVEDLEPNVETRKSSETVQSSGDWMSQGIVRDYNHKRIVDDSKQQSSNISCNNVKCVDKTSIVNLRIKMEPASKETPSRRKGVEQLLCYLQNSPGENKEIHRSFSDIPRKVSGLGSAVGKNFGLKEKERERREKPQISVKDRLKLDYLPSNDSYADSGHNKKVSPKSELTQKVVKNNSRESKGGITKINRKVQKQLRTAAPKLIRLPTVDIQKNVLSSEDLLDQNKSEDSNKKDDWEEMDWEPIEPEKVVMHVEALRKEGGFQNTVNPDLMNLCNMDTEVLSQWFVVLDTNVLLSHLGFLRILRDINDEELGMPMLIVPWIVLQELDNLKSSNRKIPLQFQARKAINFLYDNLTVRHPRVRGQPKAEADEHADLQPDDSILQCSLNLLKYSDKMLLLTNDHNLCNKAIVNGVQCCSAAKLIQDLESRRNLTSAASVSSSSAPECTYPLYHATVQTAKQCIGVVLEEVLRTEMVLVYDRKWSEVVAKRPPWTLNDILFCLLKHWIAVFQLVLPSAAQTLIEEIRLFVNNEMYEDSFEKVEKFIKTCISLMQFVSSLSYKEYVDNTLKTLKELQKTLKKQAKLSTSVPASKTFLVKEKVNDAVSSISSTTQPGTSVSVSVISLKNEQQSHSTASAVSSGNCTRSSVGGPKIDGDDDCLSLFASSISEDIVNNQTYDGGIKRGQELAHKYLNKIWEEVATFCGMLCDVMGVEPCVPFQAPEPLPALGTLQHNVLPYVTCVCTLIRCIEGILSVQPNELKEDTPALVNLYAAIKESLPTWNEFEEVLLPQHLLIYCMQSDTREQLECGRKQFEQFEAVLNQAVKFFLRQIQGNTSASF